MDAGEAPFSTCSIYFLCVLKPKGSDRQRACGRRKRVEKDVPDGLSGNRVLIVFYEAGQGRRHLMKQVRKTKCSVVYDYRNFNAVALSVPEGEDMNSVIYKLRYTKGVLQVQRDRIYKPDAR